MNTEYFSNTLHISYLVTKLKKKNPFFIIIITLQVFYRRVLFVVWLCFVLCLLASFKRLKINL